MANNSQISDRVRNLFSKDISQDDSDADAILLVLHQLITLENTHYNELNSKLDHKFALQPKLNSGGKSKKTKKDNDPTMVYFLNEYGENPKQFAKVLKSQVVKDTLNEFEDLWKDEEDEEVVKNKQAQCVWTQLVVNDKDLYEVVRQMAVEANGEEEAPVSKKKSSTKKAPKVAKEETKAKAKPKTKKSSKSKKAEEEVEEDAAEEDDEVVEAEEDAVEEADEDAAEEEDDEEEVEEKPKKPTKKSSSKKAPAAAAKPKTKKK